MSVNEGEAAVEVSERALARKYGLRELVWPEAEDARTLTRYLADVVATKHSGAVPKTTVVTMLDFLQGVLNRQYLTKSPRMPFDEYEALQQPYHVASQIITRILHEKRELRASRNILYQTTQLRLADFIELLRSVLDPGCSWMIRGTISDAILEQFAALHEFVERYPEARRKDLDYRAAQPSRNPFGS